MIDVKPGITLELSEKVTKHQSAAQVGSGGLDVYSTPSMIALMEKTSMECVRPYLSEQDTTVGGAVNIKHYKPTSIGKTVVCKSSVLAMKGSKIEFHVEVFENGQLVGDGKHIRFVVNKDIFISNL